MPDIIATFNNTSNSAYISYAKLTYSVSYSDNPATLQSTATITASFYIKPDDYTYTGQYSDTLYIGLRKGSSGATMEKKVISPTVTDGSVSAGTYNLVGTTTFTVTYTSTSTYNVYLCAGYTNTGTSRFAPVYIPKSEGGSYVSYSLSPSSNVITLAKRITNTSIAAPTNLIISDLNPSLTDTVKLSWGASSTSGILGYKVYRNGEHIYTTTNTSCYLMIDKNYIQDEETILSVSGYTTANPSGDQTSIIVKRIDKELYYSLNNELKRIALYIDSGGTRKKISCVFMTDGNKIRLIAKK